MNNKEPAKITNVMAKNCFKHFLDDIQIFLTETHFVEKKKYNFNHIHRYNYMH